MTHLAEPMRRELGLISATALVVGEVIAVGIFLTPAQMLKSLGSPALVLLVWVVMGAMALSGALCYGELAARLPQAGGGYVFLREAYGRRVAFLYGWKCFLVMDPGITAALAIGMATYVGALVHLSIWGTKSVAIGAILALAVINVLGIKTGAWVIRCLATIKLGLLATIILLAFAARAGDWANFSPLLSQHPGCDPLLPALLGGMMAAFFSFGGWWDLSKLGGEVRDPAHTLPRALVAGVVIVTAVYIATSAAFIYLVPLQRVASGEAFAAQAGEALFGRVGAQVFSFIVIISVLGSLAGLMMAAPRVYYAMARDEIFFKRVASLHPRFGTPAIAIGLQAALACVLIALGTFNEIIAYFIFATVAFLALTVMGMFLLRRKSPQAQTFKTPGYPATPLVFLALVIALLGLLLARKPLQALLGVAVVLAGAPVYRLFFATASDFPAKPNHE